MLFKNSIKQKMNLASIWENGEEFSKFAYHIFKSHNKEKYKSQNLNFFLSLIVLEQLIVDDPV